MPKHKAHAWGEVEPKEGPSAGQFGWVLALVFFFCGIFGGLMWSFSVFGVFFLRTSGDVWSLCSFIGRF